MSSNLTGPTNFDGLMQFLVLAQDGTDVEAQARRQAVRPAHIALGDKMRAEGIFLFGTAILDNAGDMIGSMMVLDFADRSQLDAWLTIEPYVTGDVWRQIDVKSCRVGPTFQK